MLASTFNHTFQLFRARFMVSSNPKARPLPGPGSNTAVRTASYLLAAALCLAVLLYGLLPGLLAVCLGHLFASALSARQRLRGPRLSPVWASAIVIATPIIALTFLFANAKGVAFGAVAQYQALLHHLAGTVLEIRQKLPPDLAAHLPDELLAAQSWLVDYLQSQAHALTGFGTAGLRGSLLVYVGLVVGALMVGTPAPLAGAHGSAGPLRQALHQRGSDFMNAFRQIVVAQFWIAAFNAACTAAFLWLALPSFGVSIPYSATLVGLTFVAGLIPIVGNLLCNSVLTIAGVSVSPTVGLACLLFLVAIHKFEYVINAKVVGKRTNTAAWELLTVMFIGEAIFGMAGLVAAPLYYAYAKRELHDSGLI
jgi:predicted PurR-regulated permease PerM